jgi:hypothetical protein
MTTRLEQMKQRAADRALGLDGVIRGKAEEADLNTLATLTFGTDAGGKFLAYLKSITINHVQGPAVSSDELRHIEGQRYIVAIIERRLNHAGRGRPDHDERRDDDGNDAGGATA